MDARSRAALSDIRRCVLAGRYRLLRHFTRQMDRRGLFWLDVLAAVGRPQAVRSGGRDRFNRPKWILAGWAADGLWVEVVCAMDTDEDGEMIVFITVY